MTIDIMASILGKINRQMEVAKRKIVLFMDNAPCHPESLSEQYSNIKVVVLPKKNAFQASAVRCRDHQIFQIQVS